MEWGIFGLLPDLGAGLHLVFYRGDGEVAEFTNGAEDHALALNTANLAGFKVSDEEHLLAYELFGLVVIGYAAEDGAILQTISNPELKQLVGLGYLLALKDSADANVHPGKFIDGNALFHGLGTVAVLHAGLHVGFLTVEELLHLSIDDSIFNLLEQKFGLVQLMSLCKELGAAEALPAESLHAKHATQLLAAEGKERLKGDGEVGSELQAEVEYGAHAGLIGLGKLPGLGVGEVLVADAGKVHGLLLCIAEPEVVEELLHLGLHADELLDGLMIIVGPFPTLGYTPLEVLLGKDEGAIDEVAIDSHQLVVVTSLKVLPREVVILGLGSIGGEHVAQHILLAGELLKVLVEPYGPVVGGGNLVILKVEEFVGGHIVGQDETALGLQHGGEYDAVEHDVVLANEVDETCRGVLPPSLPVPLFGMCLAELLGVGDIADGCIEPYVEYLAFHTLHRHGDTPIEITSYGTRVQTAVNPALALAIDVGTPFFMLFENPLLKPRLVLVERQVPMRGLALDQGIAGEGIARVDELLGREGTATILTLVAIGTLRMAARTLAHDIAVGKELMGFIVVELLALHLHELVVVIELTEKVAGYLMMDVAGGTAIYVERNAEPFERILDDLVITIDDILRRAALLLGTNGDRHTMFVTATDEEYFLTLQAQITYIDVGRYIHTGQVTDVHWSIGIRKCRRDKCSFEFLFHHGFSIFIFGRY